MSIERITDHAARARARLPGHLREREGLGKVLEALAGRHQDLEAALGDLLDKRVLSAASGAQLDALGTLLELPRMGGQNDAAYRLALFARGGSLKQGGEAEALIGAYRYMTAGQSVMLGEYPPATVELTAIGEADTPDPALDAATVRYMDTVKAGGVGLLLQKAVTPAFLWGDGARADPSGDLAPSPHGLGDAADADVNGDIAPGVAGGNFGRVLA